MTMSVLREPAAVSDAYGQNPPRSASRSPHEAIGLAHRATAARVQAIAGGAAGLGNAHHARQPGTNGGADRAHAARRARARCHIDGEVRAADAAIWRASAGERAVPLPFPR